MPPTFSPPTEEDTKRLASQWMSVSRLVEEVCGRGLTQAVEDLDYLQRVLDEDEIDSSTYARQCLGVALGRVMTKNIDGLDWWIVQDEYGRDPCLRYRHTTLQINPLTMISKRLERGELVSVRELYRRTIEAIASRKDAIDGAVP
jgi:Domain of unknown function (DUF3806)